MQEAFETTRARIRQPLQWFPLPALVVTGLAMVIGGHLLLELNPRVGVATEIFSFPADEGANPAIYITMRPDDESLIVTLNNQEEFRMPLKEVNAESLAGLNEQLKDQVQKRSIESGRAGLLDDQVSNVTLAVDQRLAYYHVRPIINSLAAVGVTEYGFETLVPADTLAAPQPPHATEEAPQHHE